MASPFVNDEGLIAVAPPNSEPQAHEGRDIASAPASIFKALFIPTSNSGVQLYRFFNFAMGAYRSGVAQLHHLWYEKNLNSTHAWETRIADPLFTRQITFEIQAWAQQADAIVMQMVHYEPSLRLFRALQDMFPDKPVLAEIDDQMLAVPTYNAADLHYRPGTEQRDIAIAQFREADGMIVSTPYLKEVYSEFNENIYVVPNSIDFKVWDKVKPKKKPGIRIGWAGGSTHEGDIRVIEPAIKAILAKHKNVEFIFNYNNCPQWIKDLGVTVLNKWHRIDKYPQAMASMGCDIWLAPLVDNAFNRGKSNLRWLEGSALRLPTVASNVGHFKETIRNGVDGFLAKDAGEFEMYLSLLIEDKKRRRAMGAKAYARVYEDFNIEKTATIYTDALKDARTKVKPRGATQ